MGIKKSRVTAAYCIIALFVVLLVFVMIYAMVINDSNVGTVGAYTNTVDAARGEILDRNGEALVTNRKGNSITFDASGFPTDKEQQVRNKEILSLIDLFDANKVEYINNLPIVLNGGQYQFKVEDKNDKLYLKWLKIGRAHV